jgi:hypothetical protein
MQAKDQQYPELAEQFQQCWTASTMQKVMKGVAGGHGANQV